MTKQLMTGGVTPNKSEVTILYNILWVLSFLWIFVTLAWLFVEPLRSALCEERRAARLRRWLMFFSTILGIATMIGWLIPIAIYWGQYHGPPKRKFRSPHH